MAKNETDGWEELPPHCPLCNKHLGKIKHSEFGLRNPNNYETWGTNTCPDCDSTYSPEDCARICLDEKLKSVAEYQPERTFNRASLGIINDKFPQPKFIIGQEVTLTHGYLQDKSVIYVVVAVELGCTSVIAELRNKKEPFTYRIVLKDNLGKQNDLPVILPEREQYMKACTR